MIYRNVLRYNILLLIAILLTSCGCPDYGFENYTAHIYVNNKTDSLVSLELRVEYKTRSTIDYRYNNVDLQPNTDNIVEIETGAYGIWEQGHSDCDPETLSELKYLPHSAEFSEVSVVSYTICENSQTPPITYDIYSLLTDCPVEQTKIQSGWIN